MIHADEGAVVGTVTRRIENEPGDEYPWNESTWNNEYELLPYGERPITVRHPALIANLSALASVTDRLDFLEEPEG